MIAKIPIIMIIIMIIMIIIMIIMIIMMIMMQVRVKRNESLQRLQSQNLALIQQLAAQSEQEQKQPPNGATDMTRFHNQYPVV